MTDNDQPDSLILRMLRSLDNKMDDLGRKMDALQAHSLAILRRTPPSLSMARALTVSGCRLVSGPHKTWSLARSARVAWRTLTRQAPARGLDSRARAWPNPGSGQGRPC